MVMVRGLIEGQMAAVQQALARRSPGFRIAEGNTAQAVPMDTKQALID
jgi:hypothetical protein